MELEENLSQRLHSYVQKKKQNQSKELVSNELEHHHNSRSAKPSSPHRSQEQNSGAASRKSRFTVDNEGSNVPVEGKAKSSHSGKKSVSISSPSSSSTDSDGLIWSEIRKGRFFVSEHAKENFQSPMVPSIDTFIQKQTPKIGRFTLNSDEEQAGPSSTWIQGSA